MALENKRACIWHAFDALGDQSKGSGTKSQLKVLTHNLASPFGIYDAQVALEEYRSGSTISFEDYLEYLQAELFTRLTNDNNNINSWSTSLDRIDNVCWLVCTRKYGKLDNCILSDTDRYKLWRVFNAHAEITEGGELVYPVVVDSAEVLYLVQRFHTFSEKSYDEEEYSELLEPACLQYIEVLTLFSQKCCKDLVTEIISAAINDLYDESVLQVIKKGYLVKQGHKFTSWKERWFVLTPHVLRYYTTREEKELKGETPLSPANKVELVTDKPDKSGKLYHFQLLADGRTYDVSAHDVKTRLEWVSALQKAIEGCNKPLTKQQEAWKRRKMTRETQRSKVKEEVEKRLKEVELIDLTRKQLEEEKQARAAAEAKLQEEAQLREMEALRRRELEEMQQQLEKLLEEERQAKHDEEIVRNLQARILQEQFEKSDELERMQAEMEMELKEERRKREDLEELREQQEILLLAEQQKLEKLVRDRQAADTKLQEAMTKIQEAEKSTHDLKSRIKETQSGFTRGRLTSLPMDYITHRGRGAFSDAEFKLRSWKSLPEDDSAIE